MKVLLYSEHFDKIQKSGLGKSILHQARALELNNIDYTMNDQEPFDLLHINTYFPQSYLFAHRCFQEGIPVVFHAHSTMDDFRNSFRFSNVVAPAFKQWLTLCYRQSDVLVTPTPYAQRILESYRLDQPIHAISNGVDLAQFQPIPQARQRFLDQYHFQADDFVVMGIGLYLERKGILDFVELARRLPQLQFIWFGYTDLRLIPDKVRQAVTTQLPNLHFAGYVPNDQIRLALQACDLYLFPTWEETEGIPVVEACASRTPFIVRDIPVFDGWLQDRVNVYKAQDIDDFEALILESYHHRLPDLTDTAYQVALDRDLPIIGQQLAQVYQEAMQRADQRQG